MARYDGRPQWSSVRARLGHNRVPCQDQKNHTIVSVEDPFGRSLLDAFLTTYNLRQSLTRTIPFFRQSFKMVSLGSLFCTITRLRFPGREYRILHRFECRVFIGRWEMNWRLECWIDVLYLWYFSSWEWEHICNRSQSAPIMENGIGSQFWLTFRYLN